MVNDADGSEYTMRAVYDEVDRPSRLVFAETEVEGGMTTTITFNDLGDGRTAVITHQTNVPAMYRTREAQEGFATSLDRCDAYVAALVAGGVAGEPKARVCLSPDLGGCDPDVPPVDDCQMRSRDKGLQVAAAQQEEVVDHFLWRGDIAIAIVPGKVEKREYVEHRLGHCAAKFCDYAFAPISSSLRPANCHQPILTPWAHD